MISLPSMPIWIICSNLDREAEVKQGVKVVIDIKRFEGISILSAIF